MSSNSVSPLGVIDSFLNGKNMSDPASVGDIRVALAFEVQALANAPAPTPTVNLLAVTANITSAQLLALHTSPVSILPAPGPGLVNDVLFSSWNYIYGGTPYTANGASLSLCYHGHNNDALFEVSQNSFISQSHNMFINAISSFGSGGSNTGGFASTDAINTGIDLFAPNGSPTLGNGTLTLSLIYRLLAVS